jgi:hypothetical protein
LHVQNGQLCVQGGCVVGGCMMAYGDDVCGQKEEIRKENRFGSPLFIL